MQRSKSALVFAFVCLPPALASAEDCPLPSLLISRQDVARARQLSAGPLALQAGGVAGTWQAVGKDGQAWLREATARVEARDGTFGLTDPRYQLAESKEPASDAFGRDPYSQIIEPIVSCGKTRRILVTKESIFGRSMSTNRLSLLG